MLQFVIFVFPPIAIVAGVVALFSVVRFIKHLNRDLRDQSAGDLR
jgi:hypothetical protein